ncbi:hypothetical protein PAXRUDRAFT_834152 [Paxillus rubicundulus Ve08.2h10]|uniref:Uncharacterized protein n=1 Tax=Paxillus rubicundulus Ve08.2h10 TaxID=930991 RepID=A0A0D0C8W2_9AGAM|nr:hypothetical protein PAXRUDRAFT_834152 [Paxillus rubicundulus Ve08.2h10]
MPWQFYGVRLGLQFKNKISNMNSSLRVTQVEVTSMDHSISALAVQKCWRTNKFINKTKIPTIDRLS